MHMAEVASFIFCVMIMMLLFMAFWFLGGISEAHAATITLTPSSGTLPSVIIGNSDTRRWNGDVEMLFTLP